MHCFDTLDTCHEGVDALRALSTILLQVLHRGDADCLDKNDVNGLSTLFRHELDGIEGGLTTIREAEPAEAAPSAEEATRAKLRHMMTGQPITNIMAGQIAPHMGQRNYAREVAEATGIAPGVVATVIVSIFGIMEREGLVGDTPAFTREFGDEVVPANEGFGTHAKPIEHAFAANKDFLSKPIERAFGDCETLYTENAGGRRDAPA